MRGEMRHGRPLLAALAAALSVLPTTVAAADPPDLAPDAPSRVAVRDGRLTFLATVRNHGGPLVLDATRARHGMRADQLIEQAAGRFTVRRRVARLRYRRGQWRLRGLGRYELYRAADGALVRSRPAPAPCEMGLQCGLPGVLALRFGVAPTVTTRAALDVAGLPAGDYRLVHLVNPDVALLESEYANNFATQDLHLSG